MTKREKRLAREASLSKRSNPARGNQRYCDIAHRWNQFLLPLGDYLVRVCERDSSHMVAVAQRTV